MNTINKKKENIRDMFDSIAHRYDMLNHIFSIGIDRRWRKKIVEDVYINNYSTLLDVATGTADLAIAIAKKCRNIHINGIDLSKGMLDIGVKKVASNDLSNRITLSQEDALEMPYADGCFEAVTVAFGVRNFEDLSCGLNQMHRVLRNGGKLYILELSIPQNIILKSLYKLYFNNILPLIGRITSKDNFAYSYLPKSVMDFPSGKKFTSILNNAGFTKTDTRKLTLGIATLYISIK